MLATGADAHEGAGAGVLSMLVWAGTAVAVSRATVPWLRIGARVAGSWLAAIAVLLIALVLVR